MGRLIKLILSFVLFFSVVLAETTIVNSPTEHYTITKKIGEGAFGKVYAVENPEGEKFALKTYKGITGEPSMQFLYCLDDLEREYSRGQELDHPHIIKTIEYFHVLDGQDTETRYLVLQYVDGIALRRVEKKSISQKQALLATLELIDALQHGLDRNLVYLDLHLDNIMMSRGDGVMVIDLASFFNPDELAEFVLNFFYFDDEDETVSLVPAAYNARMFKKAFMAKKSAVTVQEGKNPFIEMSNEEIFAAYLPQYVDQITEICGYIISISDFSHEEKARIRAEIKQVSWRYILEADDGDNHPVEFYFEEIVETLQSHLENLSH
ncbi:MAG: protein kinase [Chlamydiales bacterium]|nr:protein kinase [Chlamydiia bacterium]MCP5508259.1 protein kinase [Chlamydiales bacterium]